MNGERKGMAREQCNLFKSCSITENPFIFVDENSFVRAQTDNQTRRHSVKHKHIIHSMLQVKWHESQEARKIFEEIFFLLLLLATTTDGLASFRWNRPTEIDAIHFRFPFRWNGARWRTTYDYQFRVGWRTRSIFLSLSCSLFTFLALHVSVCRRQSARLDVTIL